MVAPKLKEGWILPGPFIQHFHYFLEGNLSCLCGKFDRFGKDPLENVSKINRCPKCEEMLKEITQNAR